MHIHTVFFWLADAVDAAGRKAFEAGLDRLTREPHIRERRIGTPAATDRPVIDSTYSYAIILHFDDLAAHDAYQVSEDHRVFLETCASMWTRVQVYDVDESGASN